MSITRRGDPASRAPSRDPADAIERAASDLEDLARDMRSTGRARPATEDLEERAHQIAGAIRAVFRGAPRASAPPLGRIGTATVF